jgi:hypothetical protein
MGRMSRQKGKRGERELAAELNRALGEHTNARRGVQFQGGPGSPDVVIALPLHIECKRTETLNAYAALEQAKADAPDGVPAMVCHRRNGQKWIAIVEVDSLADVAQRIATHIATRK